MELVPVLSFGNSSIDTIFVDNSSINSDDDTDDNSKSFRSNGSFGGGSNNRVHSTILSV